MRPKRSYHKRNELVYGYVITEHPYYSIWSAMLSRCYVEKDKAFKNYGGRGIRVCSRWLHFKNFVDDMGTRPSAEHTLDRTNNDLGYNKDNCRWADRSTQGMNRRRFKNNTTGYSGVIKVNGRYEARLDYKGKRYKLGRFASIEEAACERAKAFNKIKEGDVPKEKLNSLWCTSSTKHRGVTRHKDGGYVVRITENGIRKYLGYFGTLEEAVSAKNSRHKERNRPT